MNAYTKIRPARVIGPLGDYLTIETLPSPETIRWVARRKAEVVAAVKGGLLSIEEACERYDLSLDEFMFWQRTVERSGMRRLRVKMIRNYKSAVSQQDDSDARMSAAPVRLWLERWVRDPGDASDDLQRTLREGARNQMGRVLRIHLVAKIFDVSHNRPNTQINLVGSLTCGPALSQQLK
jgi:hypothetical protein